MCFSSPFGSLRFLMQSNAFNESRFGSTPHTSRGWSGFKNYIKAYCVHNSFYSANPKSSHINSGMQNKCINMHPAFDIVVLTCLDSICPPKAAPSQRKKSLWSKTSQGDHHQPLSQVKNPNFPSAWGNLIYYQSNI